MNQTAILHALEKGAWDSLLHTLYGFETIQESRNRISQLLEQHLELFGPKEVKVISSPGRTELGGNHTDHNQGKVIAASVHLDAVAVVSPEHTSRIDFVSEGYAPLQIDISSLEPREEEKGRTESLVRGVWAGVKKRGFDPKGFQGVIQSRVPAGSGLSSSAVIEVLLGSICNTFFAGGTLSPLDIALMGKEAENKYFGKPCGLMDQIACATGGICTIDFQNPFSPIIEQIPTSFEETPYALFLVDTGSSHADLTEDYASIPIEMRKVAKLLQGNVLRDISKQQFFEKLPSLRGQISDRAILRALHFFRENERVDSMKQALQTGQWEKYLTLVQESGQSSWTLLQNCVSTQDPSTQPVPLSLALAEEFLKGEGAFRVHGGGFAGTIQVYVPRTQTSEFTRFIETYLGSESVHPIRIRPQGTTLLCE